MKKHNRFSNNMVLIGIIIPILVFFVSMNATFAYFTATAEKKQAVSETAIVKIQFSDDTSTLINSSKVTSSVQLMPGDTLTIDGDLENAGNVAVYAILEFEVYVTKKDSSEKETAIHKYYTFANNTLTEITGSAGNYSANATMLYVDSPNNSKGFTLNYLFDGNTYGNEYKNATVTYSVNGYAIQTVNIPGGVSEATELLLNNAGYKYLRIYGNSYQSATPTVTSPVEMQSVGEKTKNLINMADTNLWNATRTTISSNTSSTLTAPSSPNVAAYIMYTEQLQPATYTISGDVSSGAMKRFIIKCYNSSGALLTGSGTTGQWTYNAYYQGWYADLNNQTIIVPNTVSYWQIGFVFYNPSNEIANCTWSNIQVEEGSTATEFEPYGYKIPVTIQSKNTFNIYLDAPLRKVGEYADYIDVQTGTLVRNVRHLELAIADMNNNESYPGWASVQQIALDHPNCNSAFNLATSYITNINAENIGVGVNTLGSGILILYTNAFNLNQTEWMSNYPDLIFKIDYGLQTPETETISVPDLGQYEGSVIEIGTTIQPSEVILDA